MISLLIVFWGLHQAWQLTRKVALDFRGPFRVGGDGPSTPGGIRPCLTRSPAKGAGRRSPRACSGVPGCHRLTHGERLKELAAGADAAERAGDFTGALVAWREALELLPPGTRQHEQVVDRISSLGRQAECRGVGPHQPRPRTGGRREGGVVGQGGAGGPRRDRALPLQVQVPVIFLLTKAKFLILGLTKASTFFSMLASFGVYWTVFGWKFGAGAGPLDLRPRDGARLPPAPLRHQDASAPMFIPGFGALVRLKQAFHDVRQEARVGLAGPVWGLAAALACLRGSFAFGSPVLAAIAESRGAAINLFNLIPVWQLDGGRAFRALSRSQRWLAAAAVALAWTQTHEGLLVILMLAAAFRAISEPGAEEPDRGALVQYVVLVAALSALLMIPVAV